MADAEKKKQDELSLTELIRSLHKWWKYLLSQWVIIVIFGLGGAIGGLVYSILKKAVYTASYSFVLEEDSGTGLGGSAGGLASIIGIDVGGATGANTLFKGENIFELYRSRRMIMKTLLTPVEFTKGKPELIIDRYITSHELRKDWTGDPVLEHLNFDIPQERFTVVHDSIITELYEQIIESEMTVEKPDKKLSIVQVSMELTDQLLAKEFVEHIVENVNAFYTLTKTKKAAQNVKVLERQADSVRQVLNLSIGRTASAQEANPNANEVLRSLEVPTQKRQIDVEASSAIYQEIVKQLEVSRGLLQRATPLIQDIDRPVLPLKKYKKRKMVLMPEFAIVAVFIIAVILIVKKIWQDEIKLT